MSDIRNAAANPQTVAMRYGELFVPSGDDLIANALRRYGEWAQNELDIVCSLLNPGDVVVDAGAYIGSHSRAFSHAVGRSGHVHAFEPVPPTFALLQHNALAAPDNNISTHDHGLAREAGTCRFHLEAEPHNLASASMVHSTDEYSIEVRLSPLDALELSRLDLLKVDVEGMEMSLLEGATRTIARCRPIIFLEVLSLEAGTPLMDWARKNAYLVYGINTAAFNEDNFAKAAENMFGSARETAVLLIDAERIAAYQPLLLELDVPRLESIDDLAVLLLHKPQYIADVLNQSPVASLLGMAHATPEQTQIAALQQALEAKDTALEDAASAYQALRHAYDEKESYLQRSLAAFERETQALRLAQQDATQAYNALHQAYVAKERKVQRNVAAAQLAHPANPEPLPATPPDNDKTS